MTLSHGSYSTKTLVEIKCHVHYWRGEEGYIDVIEIKDPPSGRCGVVVLSHNFRNNTYSLLEWNDIPSALTMADALSSNIAAEFAGCDGFIGIVILEHGQKPWFYAQAQD